MPEDGLAGYGRVYLERLRLATDVLLSAAEETGFLNDVVESELVLVREKLEHALLLAPNVEQPA